MELIAAQAASTRNGRLGLLPSATEGVDVLCGVTTVGRGIFFGAKQSVELGMPLISRALEGCGVNIRRVGFECPLLKSSGMDRTTGLSSLSLSPKEEGDEVSRGVTTTMPDTRSPESFRLGVHVGGGDEIGVASAWASFASLACEGFSSKNWHFGSVYFMYFRACIPFFCV